ncbi:MAG: helix-turn-helix transcriptional regulator [Candidatus Eremiobacteraeota bacterium]|nr:helix-turn-helix transcriptional regulator [Candidatus Eremiobacteraeota bacterium]MBV9407476.1 helix-turn-helix transcriptional regulator [Candidatus Eremiobacteraeota bacterium]
MSEPFGDRLRRLREEQGIAVSSLAPLIGISQATLRQFETGYIKSPSLMIGLRLAQALHVDPYYLAFGEASDTLARLDAVERRLTSIEQRIETATTARRR